VSNVAKVLRGLHRQCSGSCLVARAVFGLGPGSTVFGFGPGSTVFGFGPGSTVFGFGPGSTMFGFRPGGTNSVRVPAR
jgi:hypothetical protein